MESTRPVNVQESAPSVKNTRGNPLTVGAGLVPARFSQWNRRGQGRALPYRDNSLAFLVDVI